MKISLIIPVYNTANYLKDCLDTCLNQESLILNKDYEIICVNDGSTDNSAKILTEYKAQGIIVVDQANAGVSSARNNGLTHAQGDYIWFIDSDDLIKIRTSLSLLAATLDQNNNPDFICIGALSVPDNFSYLKDSTVSILPYNDNKLGSLTVWKYIVQRKFLLDYNLFFEPHIAYGEDTIWCTYVYTYAKNYAYINDALYLYRNREGSAVNIKSSKVENIRYKCLIYTLDSYARLWNKIKDNRDICSNKKKMVQHKVVMSTQNLLYAALNKETIGGREKLVATLRNQNLYPFALPWWRLSIRFGLKIFLSDLFMLFFSWPCYYKIIGYLYDIKNKRANRS